MKVGINLLFLIPGIVGGTQTYGLSLIKALSKIDLKNEYYIFINQEASSLDFPKTDKFHLITCEFRGSSRLKRYAWEQLILPVQLFYLKIDIVHSLGYVGPLLSPCSSVVTIHDINFVVLKNSMSAIRRTVYGFFAMQSGLRAKQIITISNFSKESILKVLSLPTQKVEVIYESYRPIDGRQNVLLWNELKHLYKIEEPYLVAFGGGAEHKNIARLIEAYNSIKTDFPHKLVIIGNIHSSINLEEIKNHGGVKGKVILTGYIPDEHINPILNHAELFILPSLYEGFGLPVLEAQQAGIPLVCSTAASLPEVAGKGAFYFDPMSVESLINAIQRCLMDYKLRSKLIMFGYENLRRFSWEKTAQETLSVYQSVFLSNRKS